MRLNRRVGLAAAVIALTAVLGPVGAAWGVSPTTPAAPAAPRADSDDAPVSIAVVVPITVSPDPSGSGLIDADHLRSYTTATGILTRQLDAVIDTGAVIGLDPMIVASINVLGSSAPPTARAWLQRLSGATNQIFPLAYADADPAVLTSAPDGSALLGGLDFQFAIDPANFGPAQTASPTAGATPTPTPSATPSDTVPLPTDADILDWPYTLNGIAWPSDDTVSSSALDPLADAGYHDVLLSSQNVSAADSARVDLGGIEGLVADAGVTSLVRDASYSSDDAGYADALGRLDAALQGLQAVKPGRTVIATLDRQWPIGALRIGDVMQHIESLASAQLVGLSSVIAGPVVGAKLVDESVDAADLAQARRVIATVGPEATFATVAGDDAAEITAPRHLELLSALAVSWIRADDGWSTRLNAYLTSSSKLLSAVTVVHGSNLFVTANSANIPVTISNALPVPIHVLVTVRSTSGILQIDKPQVEVTVEPNSSNKALVPAQALSNGTVTATVTLYSAAEPTVRIGDRDFVEVDVQPAWEGIGTLVVVVLLVLLFGGGILRNVLKRRASRRAPADESDD